MTRGKTKLEAEATSKGFDKVAGDAKKVDEALGGVQETTAQSTVVTEQATEAQTELNAAESDYIGVLAGISPFLGQLVATMINAAKVAGRLGTAQINLTKATKGAGAAIGKLSGVLKTLGAAALVYVGISRLISAITTLRREMKEAEEATKAVIKAQTELEKQARETAEALTASRATKRRQEPRTFEQEEAIRKTLEAAKPDIKEAIKPILEALGGAKGFGPGAGMFTGGELEALARLGFQPGDDVPQRINERRAEAHLRRRDEDRRVIEQTQRDRRKAQTQRAAEEAWAGRGGQYLQGIAARMAQEHGLDPAVLEEIAEQMLFEEANFLRNTRRYTAEAREEARRRRPRMPSERIREGDLLQGTFGGLPTVEVGGEERKITAEEIGAMTEIYKRVLPVLERMAQNGPTTHVHHGGRYYDLGEKARRDAITNGEGMRTAWEGN